MTGKVKIYNKRKGYGIIDADKDYFFRWTDIISDSHKHCEVGETVSFIPYKDVKGMRAKQVQSIKG